MVLVLTLREAQPARRRPAERKPLARSNVTMHCNNNSARHNFEPNGKVYICISVLMYHVDPPAPIS